MLNTLSPVESVAQPAVELYRTDDQVTVHEGTIPRPGVIIGFTSDGLALVRVLWSTGMEVKEFNPQSLSHR
jgi:hypothetical protein